MSNRNYHQCNHDKFRYTRENHSGIRWPRPTQPIDADWVANQIHDIFARLAILTEDIQDIALPFVGDEAETKRASDRIFWIRGRPDYQHILRFWLNIQTPTDTPAPATSAELTELRDEVKATKALVATIKSSPPPPGLPAKPTFAAITAPKPPAQPSAPRPAPPTPSNVVSTSTRSQARPRLIVRANSSARDVISKEHSSPLEIVAKLTAALKSSVQHAQVRVSAVKWTSSGNLAVIAGPDTAGEQLKAAIPVITATLSPLLPGAIAHLDVRWSKIVLHGIPTGVTSTSVHAFTPDMCHAELCANNPSYRELTVTQLPSWARAPTSYSPGSSSSLAFAFEDPDGTIVKKVLSSGPFYAFGAAAEARRWKTKPRAPVKSTPATITPATPAANSKPASTADSRPALVTQGGTPMDTDDLSGHAAPPALGTRSDPPLERGQSPPAKKRRQGTRSRPAEG